MGELGAVLVLVVAVAVLVLLLVLAVVVPARIADEEDAPAIILTADSSCVFWTSDRNGRAHWRSALEARRPRQRCPVEEDSG